MEASDPKLDFDPPTVLAELTDSSAHLIATAEGLDDQAVREPSLLPDWTRAHVLTHTARNADALRNLLSWAATGRRTDMYASLESRDQAVKDGSLRTAAELAADLRESCERFAEAAARLAPEHWSALVQRRIGGPQQASRIPWWRLEEVLIHHADLDAGFTPAHWPAQFTGPEIDLVVARFNNPDLIPDAPAFRLHAEDSDRLLAVRCAPAAAEPGLGQGLGQGSGEDSGESGIPTIEGPEPALLAWMIGRTQGDGLNVEPRGPLPALPGWM
ncbi:MAG TPA: maleylpyruvate isomerase family mycothiol-dependent enzyme [Actinocrinis sp.]|nr:maleylpyruvate isomerase family mycothiol-dependent enzyme [Actinocrinis sp.]